MRVLLSNPPYCTNHIKRVKFQLNRKLLNPYARLILESTKTPNKQTYINTLSVLIFLLICRLIANYFIPLNDATEARYAEIARKMLETGNWVNLLHDYTIPFWAKPPLSTWASALSMYLFGVNEFAARLPSLLFSCAILYLVWDLVKKHSNFLTANISILVLAGSLFFFLDAGTVMTDPSLLFCITLTNIAFWHAIVDKNRVWSYVFFAALGLGLLAKGPIAVVLTGLPIFFWVVLRKQWKDLWECLPWLKGSFLTLAIALPWYILAEIRTPGFLNYFIIGEHLSRFLIPGWTGDRYGMAHNAAKGMIWVYAVLGIFPWNIFATKWLWFKGKTLPALFKDEDGWMCYWSFCMLAPLVFFTFAGNIIYPYVFPALPAFAILFATLWQQSNPSQNSYLRITQGAVICGCFFIIATLIFQIKPYWVAKTQKPVIEQWLSFKPSNKLIYWRDTPEYSAQFYAAGKVIATKNIINLHKLLTSGNNHYLAISSADLRNLPQNLLTNCKTVKSIRLKDENELVLRCESA